MTSNPKSAPQHPDYPIHHPIYDSLKQALKKEDGTLEIFEVFGDSRIPQLMIETASGAMRLLISPSGENTYEVSIHSEVPLEGDVLNALSLFAKDTEGCSFSRFVHVVALHARIIDILNLSEKITAA